MLAAGGTPTCHGSQRPHSPLLRTGTAADRVAGSFHVGRNVAGDDPELVIRQRHLPEIGPGLEWRVAVHRAVRSEKNAFDPQLSQPRRNLRRARGVADAANARHVKVDVLHTWILVG